MPEEPPDLLELVKLHAEIIRGINNELWVIQAEQRAMFLVLTPAQRDRFMMERNRYAAELKRNPLTGEPLKENDETSTSKNDRSQEIPFGASGDDLLREAEGEPKRQ